MNFWSEKVFSLWDTTGRWKESWQPFYLFLCSTDYNAHPHYKKILRIISFMLYKLLIFLFLFCKLVCSSSCMDNPIVIKQLELVIPCTWTVHSQIWSLLTPQCDTPWSNAAQHRRKGCLVHHRIHSRRSRPYPPKCETPPLDLPARPALVLVLYSANYKQNHLRTHTNYHIIKVQKLTNCICTHSLTRTKNTLASANVCMYLHFRFHKNLVVAVWYFHSLCVQ